MRDRAYRRHHLRRIKEKVRFIGRYVWKKWGTLVRWKGEPEPPIPPGEEDPRIIGIEASTHLVPCSCDSCRNPRRSNYISGKDRLTRQEKVAVLKEQEQIAELEDDE